MSPSEGERRLNSAIAPRPGWASASLNRTREPRQLVESCGGGAGVDRLSGELESFPQVFRTAGGGDRPCCVQENRIAPAAVRSREDVADRLRVLGRRAAAELGRVAAFEPQVQW